jgi:hypothetical protein
VQAESKQPDQVEALAEQHHLNAEALRELLAELRAQSGADHFYVFWNAGGGAGGASGSRSRLVLCFRSPDAALAFAQRNGLASPQPARLRRLSLVQILAATLRTPAIGLVVLADEADEGQDGMPAGRLPDGIQLQRAALLQRLGAAL